MVDWHASAIFWRHIPVSSPRLPICRTRLIRDENSYVAMHAMQEDPSSQQGHEHPSSINGYADAGPQRKPVRPQMRDTMATVGGMLLPLLTQFGHHH